MVKRVTISLLCLLIISFSMLSTAYADRDGPTIFKKVCKMCHKIDKVKIGPALGGVKDRTSREWAKKWVRNPQSLWVKNEGYTNTLRTTFKTGKKKKSTMGTTCPKLKKLTDKEVETIVDYVFTL